MFYAKEGAEVMSKVIIDEDRCKGCGLCIHFCPKGALTMSDRFNAKGHHPVTLTNEEKCTSCGICGIMCPDVAIEVYRV